MGTINQHLNNVVLCFCVCQTHNTQLQSVIGSMRHLFLIVMKMYSVLQQLGLFYVMKACPHFALYNTEDGGVASVATLCSSVVTMV